MKKFISFIVALYLGVCCAIYFYPLGFFYNPSSKLANIENAKANGYNAEVVEYSSSDGLELYGWYSRDKNSNGKVVVFFHGNSYNLEAFYYKMIGFNKAKYATFLAEYRGFGDIDGEINQKNLSNDAIAAIKKLNTMGYKNKDIYVYGMSLGTYMATNAVVEMQKNGNFAGLILEVPFDSLLNTAKSQTPIYLPLDYVIKDKYPTINIIKDVKTKLLVMLGSDDKTIPYELGKNLYNAANQPKELIIYKGAGHSNLFNFGNDKDILKWLEK